MILKKDPEDFLKSSGSFFKTFEMFFFNLI